MTKSHLEVVFGNVAGDEEVECLRIWFDTTGVHFFQDSGDKMAVFIADGLEGYENEECGGESYGRARGN
jgi:hypothetical protein